MFEDLDNKPNNKVEPLSHDVKIDEGIYQKKKAAKSKIFFVVFFVILFFGGSGFASWYYYDNYFKVPSLGELLSNIKDDNKEVDVFKLNYELDVELEIKEEPVGLDIVGVDPLSELFKDDGKNKFNLSGEEYYTKVDKDEFYSEGKLLIDLGTSLGKLSLENKYLNKKAYLKINDIPLLVAMFVNPDSIKDVWIEIDQEKEDGLINEYSDVFEKEKENTDTKAQIVENFFKTESPVEEIKKCAFEMENEREIINCRFKLKGEKMRELGERLQNSSRGEESVFDKLGDVEEESWEKVYKIFKKITYDITFTKKEHYLSNVKVFYVGDEEDRYVKNVAFEISVDNFVEKHDIEAPSESIDIEQLVNQLVVEFSRRSMGEQEVSSSTQMMYEEMYPLDDARRKSRDARRVSDIKQIQTALEIFYIENDAYADKLSDLETAGIIGKIPENPKEGNDVCIENYKYSYKVIEEKQDYQLFYCIEGGVGNVNAGYNFASNCGLDVSCVDYEISFDFDKDGLVNEEEIGIGTSPYDSDTDGDGYNDGQEYNNGYNPLGAGKLVK